MFRTLRLKLAAVVAVGGLATTAHAQPGPQVQPVPLPGPVPQVIQWNGGSVVIDGQSVVVKQNGVGGGPSVNVVTGSANGIGNRVVIDNGPGGGVTVVQDSRVGFGNSVVVGPNQLLVDVPGLPLGLQGPVVPVVIDPFFPDVYLPLWAIDPYGMAGVRVVVPVGVKP